METVQKSQFASALEMMLDKSGMFDRKSWASLFGVDREDIDNWTNDLSLPTPSNLSMLKAVIQLSDCDAAAALKEFDRIAELRASEVSPLGDLMLPSVKEYMTRPMFSNVSNMLARRNDQQKIELLREYYPE